MSSKIVGWETAATVPAYWVRVDARLNYRAKTDRRRRRRRLGLQVLVVALLASSLIGISATPSSAHHIYPKVEVLGGGWGHGRGMGQYGALGYASDHGWTSRQILDHFYGSTTQGPAPTTASLDPDRLRVQLASTNGQPTAVTLELGRMVVVDANRNRLRTVAEPALRFVTTSGGFQLQVADDCGGPWNDLAAIGGTAAGVTVELDPTDPADNGETIGRDSKTLLGVCGSVRAWYDGEIWSHQTSYGQRTVNVVTVEQYLRGVVPNEVPASWPEAVLESQAVAARSYVLAGDSRWGGHANTCDNTYCQVYDGRFTTRGGTRSATHSRTDAAIAATKDQVRLTASGGVARTEFSSSTGGHTAGGDFPAVEDLGDATSANPNATWSTTVGLTGLASRYGLGPVESIRVTQRDGNGRFGGRAAEVTIGFRDGTRTMTGSAVRQFFGLKSDLFDFGPIQFSAPEPDAEEPTSEQPPPEPEPEEPTPDQPTLEEAFAGKLIDRLYRSTFNRAADADGHAFWVDQLTSTDRSRLSYAEIGTFFFGSAEYYRRSGGTDVEFVNSLYRDLLGRPADRDGVTYWLDVLDSGSTKDVVTWFYRSEESRRDRAATLYRLVTGRTPTAGEIADGAELLQELSDLELADRYRADESS